MPHSPLRSFIVISLGLLGVVSTAGAQFDDPVPTGVRERISGVIRQGAEGIVPEAGDEIGAIFQDFSVGRFVFTSENIGSGDEPEFSILIYGDIAETSDVEGPRQGQPVQFQFYDSSANRTRRLTVLNAAGEQFSYTFQGAPVPPIPIELPGFDLTPSRSLDMRIGRGTDEGGDGDGDGDGGDNGRYDVNGDGVVDVRDAAVVLRLVTTGGGTGASTSSSGSSGNGDSSGDGNSAGSADVNGDGVVSTRDAIEILTNR